MITKLVYQYIIKRCRWSLGECWLDGDSSALRSPGHISWISLIPLYIYVLSVYLSGGAGWTTAGVGLVLQ